MTRFAFGMPTLTYPRSDRQLLGTGTQPMTDRFMYEPLPRTRTQPMLNRLRDGLPDMTDSGPDDRLSRKSAEVYDPKI